jgi:serine/threonine-protein kinase
MEPEWAEPLAQLAFAQQMQLEFGNPAARAAQSEIVRANALRAIQLDPNESMAYTALAAVQAYSDWDFAGAEATLRQGLAIDPRDGTTRGRLAFLLAARGRLQDAVNEAVIARDNEPLVPDRHGLAGMVHYYARDFTAALADMDRALAISPGFPLAHLGKGLILGAAGQHDAAIASIERALAIAENPGWIAALGVTCARAGRGGCVEDAIERLQHAEAGGAFVSVDQYAYIAGYQNHLDDAFRLLDQAIDRRMTNVLWLAVDPRADALRADPRFDAVVARMGVLSR